MEVSERIASINGSLANVTTVRITLEAASVIWTLAAFNFVFGLVCNSLVISTILRTKSLCNSSINRAVLSLCLADLLTVIVEVPLMTVTLVGNYVEFMVGITVKNQTRPWFHRSVFSSALVKHWLLLRAVLLPLVGDNSTSHVLPCHRRRAVLLDQPSLREGETSPKGDLPQQ